MELTVYILIIKWVNTISQKNYWVEKQNILRRVALTSLLYSYYVTAIKLPTNINMFDSLLTGCLV